MSEFINKKESLPWIIALHLIPGIIVQLVFYFMISNGILGEYPKLLVFSLAAFPGIILTELGILFYYAKKKTGSFNIINILGLKSKLKVSEFLLLVIVLFLLAGILISLSKPVTTLLQNTVFQGLFLKYNLMEDMSLYSKGIILLTILVNFIMFTIIYPIIEELYFRGFLLCRIERLGKYSVLINTALFALYHFWSPWMIVARTIAFLPLFYMVYKKKSLKLSITVHCLANFTDVLAMIPLLM